MPNGTRNYATALGGPQDVHRQLLPLQLIILGWSDGTDAVEEPNVGQHASVSASYRLDVSQANIPTGQKFTVFRCDGAGSLPSNPMLHTLHSQSDCAGCKCKSFAMIMDDHVPGMLNEDELGTLWSYSIVYFAAVHGTVA